ncbi:MAG: carboxypeptidase regulatory-like domain-containing protein [Candidatus Acidiferrum sp.]
MTRVFQLLVCAVVLLLVVPAAVRAQVVTASVRGTVTDEQGAAVAGADVTITNVDTGYTRSMKSGSDGAYNFPDLPLGSYRIQASHSGFKAATQTGIVLHVADSLAINVSLKVGAVTETVTVEASPVAVETTSGDLTGLIEGRQVSELPLNGRNFMQLVTLMPGVAAAEAFSTREKGIKGASDLSISGSPSNGNQWLVDGANNNDTGSQRTILVYPSTESIEEFKIERNAYGAAFGLMSGATVNLVTKSGKNGFHGSVFYSGRNDKLDAYDTLLKAGCPTCAKNKLRENDYGYTISGPVKKDKIFFFWSQEWNKKIEGLVRTSHVPGMLERTGDFSAVAACPNSLKKGEGSGTNSAGFPMHETALNSGVFVPGLHDPAGPSGNFNFGTSIVGNTTSQALLLMTQYPAPTLSDPCTNLNWTKSLNTPSPWREENIRGDINLSKSLTLMLKFTNDSWVLGPPSAGFGWGNNPLGVIDESWNQPSRIAAARLSKTIGASAVNDFQFSYSANRITLSQTNPALVQQINDAIPWFFPTSGKRYGNKGPSAWFSGWGNAHLPSVWTIAPWANAQDLYTLQDDFSVVKGRHTLKFGGVYSRNSKNEQTPNAEFGGIFGAVGYQGQWGNNTGYDVADMELKNMAISMNEASNITINDIRWQNTEFYAADNWRITPRFTLNYGVRYSLLPNPYFADDLYTSFNPAAYDPALGSKTCNGLLYSPGLKSNPCPAGTGGMPGPNRGLWNNNNRMIAPRLSFAWDPTGKGKWAIRAGGGQFFNRDRLFALQIGGTNPPFVGNFTDPNGRFLDSLTPPSAGPAFSTGLGSASIGAETSNQMPNSWQYNVTVQHELWKDARLEVGYVANRNIHWEIRSDVNAIHPADRLNYFQDNACTAANKLCGVDAGGNGITSGTARTALRPFGPMRGDSSLTYYTHSGQSSYNSLQVLFQSRFHRNSSVQVAYTWSKLISDTQLIDTPNNNLDFYSPRANRGPDQLNRPQILSANWIYNLPALEQQNSFIRNGFGAWELSSIISVATGPSMTGIMGNSPVGDPSGTGGGGNQVPMRVAGQGCRANTGDSRQWFNPNMFTLNGFVIGKKGSEGFGVCSGPGNNVVDFSLRKNFKLSERVKMQFSLDFFNLFNHPQYLASSIGGNGEFGVNFNGPARVADNPNSALYLDSAGTPIYPRSATTGSTGCGANHLASPTGTSPEAWCANSIVNTTIGNNFGIVTQSRENGWRQLQYGLKFSF